MERELTIIIIVEGHLESKKTMAPIYYICYIYYYYIYPAVYSRVDMATTAADAHCPKLLILSRSLPYLTLTFEQYTNDQSYTAGIFEYFQGISEQCAFTTHRQRLPW